METFKRGAGWVTHPKETSRIHRYWTKGPGAAKIKWGAPHDFYRCRTHLSKYIGPKWLSQTCAQWHHDALGIWPGQHGERLTSMTASVALTQKSREKVRPPREWFENPNFVAASPVVVTQEGRIMGHLATWGTCHVGFTDVCVMAPHTQANYAHFRLGAVECDDGEFVATGTITMNTGHADERANPRASIAHYDNTGLAVAAVAAGEDEFGIWVSGWVLPSTTDEQIVSLRASNLSGDWRLIGGNLELIAALAVNTPGFPVQRTTFGMEEQVQLSLTAAGVVREAEGPGDLKSIVKAAIQEYEEQKRTTLAMDGLKVFANELVREELREIAEGI